MTDKIDSTDDKRADVLRQEYRILSDLEKVQMKNIKQTGSVLLDYIDSLGQKREYSLAKTKVEEAVMWAVKGLTQ